MQVQFDDVTYITRGEEVLWGFLLLAVCLVIHGIGMVLTLRVSEGFKQKFGTTGRLVIGISPIILASWMITLVHVAEIAMWAVFFQWKECFANFSTAIYFTGLQYTTVGSSLNLPRHWRLLEIMVSSAGLMGFAWSTGVLMSLAQNFQSEQLRTLSALRLGGGRKPGAAAATARDEGQRE